MPLSSGTRLGPYEILAAIGAGGMGEVYRARDAKLNRDVALKVLPDLLAGDPDRLARFRREAQVLASLNHPSIGHIYGFEDSGATHALVLELIEGPTLADRLAQGAIPLDEALPIAKQIADALEAAHEQGIVHRDLKPANIKVRDDGTVKVLDFGLAKAMDPAGASSAEAMNSPTMTRLRQGSGGAGTEAGTELGMILGTAAYMAPEQARGKVVDRRADIWAFGVVLYEMLSGRRAFDPSASSGSPRALSRGEGDSVQDVLAAVLKDDVKWGALPADVPPAIRRLLRRCLEKDPKRRLSSIGDARLELDEAGSDPGEDRAAAATVGNVGRTNRLFGWLPWALVAACLGLAGVAWLRSPARSQTMNRSTRVELTLPSDVEFYASARISRDGARVAFIGVREGMRQMYVRELSQAQTTPVAHTDGAHELAFAPDGLTAAVITTDGRLKRVAFRDGGVEDLATGVDISGGLSWSNHDKLLFGLVTSLAWIPATGGTPKEIVAVDKAAGESRLSGPVPTPDGRHVLFLSWRGAVGALRSRVETVSIDGADRRVLAEDAERMTAVRADRILFRRNGAIYTAPFDAARAVVTGRAAQLTDVAGTDANGWMAADITEAGDLFFAEPSVLNGRLVWVTHDGVERGLPLPAGVYVNPRVSPDGLTIAYSDNKAIWTADIKRGAQTRIFVANDGVTGFPNWSEDGTHVFFRSLSGVARLRADREGKPELIAGGTLHDYPSSTSRDGKTLVLTRVLGPTSGDVVLLPVAGGEARVVVGSTAYEGGGQISPDADGKWLTYVSNSSGHMEVYLSSIDGTLRYPVSTTGGLHPLWSRDGKQIYFRSGQQMLAVDVTTSPTVRLGPPKEIFRRRYLWGPNLTTANYSLSKDGKDFLMVREEAAGHLSLIFNWLANVGK